MPFINSKICKIKIISIERTEFRGNEMIPQGVRSVIEQYQERSFKVTWHKANNKFKCSETNILDAIVDIVTKDKYYGSV